MPRRGVQSAPANVVLTRRMMGERALPDPADDVEGAA